MVNYDFRGLSSYDFEMLVRDLLQKEFGIVIESFKTGRDNGIDLRYAKGRKNLFIVQCKHFANSTFSNLKTTLKKEKEKLEKINCNRYILATSMGLTPENKNEILKILSPYLKSTADILGREDINNLICKYPDVERVHYKLWLTSTSIIDKLLHSKVYNQSLLEVDKIKCKSKFYVQNKSFFKALELLNKHNYCVITGIPGIGKTTLAEILVLYHIERDYEVYKIVNGIGEALEVYDPHKKQLFYYDDFLGQTALETKLNKNEDSQLIDFIEMIGRNKRSKFILTTREYILNQAKMIYEKLSNYNFDISNCSINLNDYTKYDKAKILFNHLYFSDIPDEYKQQIVFDKNYRKIINHPNYNPRIIELMTVKYSTNIDKTDDIDFFKRFIFMLDNPEEIWRHSYNNQLKYYSKNLLLVLTSLPDKVYIEDLKKAFNTFNKNKATSYGYSINENDFMNALKELEVTFISSQKYNNHIFIFFNNPSIRDFMENCLNNNDDEFRLLLNSSIYFNQIQKLSTIKAKSNKSLLQNFGCEMETAIKKTFFSNNLLIAGQDSTWKINKSLALRLAYIANLFREVEVDNADLIKDLLFHLIENLTFEQLKNFFDAVSQLIKSGYEDLVKSPMVIKKVKSLIIEHEFMDDLDDYCIIEYFLKLYPEVMDEREKKYFSKKFEDYYEKIINIGIFDIDYSNALQEYKDKLESVGEIFNVDVSYELRELDKRIDELIELENQENIDEDYYDDYEESALEESEIDDMFDAMFE